MLAATSTEFKYSYLYPNSRHTPDPNNHVVIKMRKLRRAEPLVEIRKEHKLPFTDTPLSLDLLTGRVSDGGGEFQLVIARTPGSLSKQNPGDWSIEFKPVNGGIMEPDNATARVTHEAPAEGYQNSYLVQMQHEAPAWFDNIQKKFLLTSRGGEVRNEFTMDFVINNDPSGTMWFQFRGVANDHNSRNWEEARQRSRVVESNA